jgi:hypothetical protein
MIILGIIFSVFAIGFFCWLMFTLAVYALPFLVGMTAAFAAYHHGFGVFESAVIAILAGGATLGVGRFAFANLQTPILRGAIALTFAAPAVIAGYYATLGVAHIGIASGILSNTLALLGAATVGGTAWSRLVAFAPPVIEQSAVGDQASLHAHARASG